PAVSRISRQLFCSLYLPKTMSTRFPYTTLFRSIAVELGNETRCWPGQRMIKRIQNGLEDGIYPYGYNLTEKIFNLKFNQDFWDIDRKSTRLNSSHVKISYAVFCLKKKKTSNSNT